MDKRTAQIVDHVSPETASMFRSMAELEETSCSEKAGDLVTEYLESKKSLNTRVCGKYLGVNRTISDRA